ncbi:benzoate 4-monooxygenase cytochrome P450 [Diaporthe helianthi]|uniref:Benzoate 4-monooxygenase cytochrome P450 n=1 Tax=Diaporthe helianthi TaxID=158607 RepID=A0A2P5HWQ1_DIAHE|nr:benzoate 4-monooxygenase cytochrome P450 [Diaporthe helianthi]
MANVTPNVFEIVILLLEVLLVSVVLRCFYNLFLHPLRRFPGPIAHRASVLPIAVRVALGRWTTELLPLTEKFGPVVRVSPNELVFTDPEAWFVFLGPAQVLHYPSEDDLGARSETLANIPYRKDVYGYQNGALSKGEEFPKAPSFYRNRGVPPSIVSETRENHALLRRQMSPGFSDRSLREQEKIVKGYVDLLIRRLQERCAAAQGGDEQGTKTEAGGGGGDGGSSSESRTAVDMRLWFNYATFDIIGDLAFGESFGCLEHGRTADRVSSIEMGLKAQGLNYALKLLGMERLVKWLVRSRAKFRRDNDRLTTAVLKRRMALETERHDLNWEPELPMKTLMINSMVLIVAGSDTAATLLSGLIYLLLKNPGCFEKITHEIRSAFKSEDEINFSSVQSLPYMFACIRETFRCYPPVPGSAPRVVPKGGANIAGQFVPEGTTVSVAQWPTYHSTRNFSQPFSFQPDRFLQPEKYPDDKLGALQPFGIGPRDCIGKNLAYAEVKLVLARILYNFDMELVDPGEDWMDQRAFFIWTKPPLNIYLTPGL